MKYIFQKFKNNNWTVIDTLWNQREQHDGKTDDPRLKTLNFNPLIKNYLEKKKQQRMKNLKVESETHKHSNTR